MTVSNVTGAVITQYAQILELTMSLEDTALQSNRSIAKIDYRPSVSIVLHDLLFID